MSEEIEHAHDDLRTRAHDLVLAGLAQAVEKNLRSDEFVICAFDVNDPFSPDPIVEQMRAEHTNHCVMVLLRPAVIQALREYEMPAPEVGARWSISKRAWVVDGVEIEECEACLPHTDLAAKLEGMEPREHVFVMLTFARGAVRMTEQVLVERGAIG